MNRRNIDQFKAVASRMLLVMGVVALAACGGGGGGKSSSVAPDTTPKTFTFTPQTDVLRNAVVISNTATISGINTATNVKITNGEYAIGSSDDFVSADGTITNGQSIKVRINAPDDFDETQAAELDVGGVKATFSVTTEKQDTEPKAFTFNPVIDAQFDSEHASGEITVEDINDTTAISIANGKYSINGDDFTEAEGTVNLSDKIFVKGVAASTTDTTKDITLTIGGVPGVFSITTFSDTTPPTAKIAFPPPISKTANNSVIVRGTAEDDYNDIESVEIYVNGTKSDVEIELDKTTTPVTWTTLEDEAESKKGITLNAGENLIEVVVTDSIGNKKTFTGVADTTETANVKVANAPFGDAFPVGEAGGSFDYVRTGFVIDDSTGSLRTLSTTTAQDCPLVITDLGSGQRTDQFISGLPEGEDVPFQLYIDPTTKALYVVSSEGTGSGLAKVDMATWEVQSSITIPQDIFDERLFGLTVDYSRTEPRIPRILFGAGVVNAIGKVDADLSSVEQFSSNSSPNDENIFEGVIDVGVHPKTGEIIAINNGSADVYSISPDNENDLLAGERTPLSSVSNAVDDAANWSGSMAMAFDVYGGRNRLLVTSMGTQSTLLSVDLDSKVQSLFSDEDANNPLGVAYGIDTHPDIDYALVQDRDNNAIYAIDLISGQRVIITKSKQD